MDGEKYWLDHALERHPELEVRSLFYPIAEKLHLVADLIPYKSDESQQRGVFLMP